MRRYLAYVRVSTVKQGEHSSSLQEQRASIEAYALKHNLEISAWYEEMETAAKAGRQTFNRMLSEIEKGNAAGIIIHKIDRSARNLKDWAHLGELIDLGVEVHFAHESLDLASRGGRLAADIQAVVAADYIRNLRQEVRKGFYGRLKQGLYPLPAPRGYLNQGRAKLKVIDPVEGPLVRQAFELYASGSHSIYTLRHELRARGLCGRRGKPLTQNALSVILRNSFYMGVIQIGRTGESFPGAHEPLISVSTFQQVQALMSGRAYARPQKHAPLFRRLIKCLDCGYHLTGEVQKGHVYYRCHSRTCRGTSIREGYVFKAIEAYLNDLSLPESDIKEFRDLAEADSANAQAEAHARRERQTLKLNLCENRLTKLTDAFLDETIEKVLFDKRKKELLLERQELLDQLKDRPLDTIRQRIVKMIEVAMSKNVHKFKYAPELRELVLMTTSNLSISGKELIFEPLFPFGHILNWLNFKNGAPSRVILRKGVSLTPRQSADGMVWWLDLNKIKLDAHHSEPLDFLNVLYEEARFSNDLTLK